MKVVIVWWGGECVKVVIVWRGGDCVKVDCVEGW